MPNHQVMRFQHASAPARRASPAPWGGRPAAQAGGEALARAAALAVAAAAAGDAAPAELLDAHLEAAATHNPVQDPGLHPGAPHEGAQPAAAAGAPAADAAAAPARGAGPGAELGPERAGAALRLFDLRLALGQPEGAAAAVVAAADAAQCAGDLQARTCGLCSHTHVAGEPGVRDVTEAAPVLPCAALQHGADGGKHTRMGGRLSEGSGTGSSASPSNCISGEVAQRFRAAPEAWGPRFLGCAQRRSRLPGRAAAAPLSPGAAAGGPFRVAGDMYLLKGSCRLEKTKNINLGEH